MIEPERTAELDEWARRIVDQAPPLTEDQRNKLAELLRPVRIAATPPKVALAG